MESKNYVVFKIFGIKHEGYANTFEFYEDAVHEVSNDKFIEKVVVSADISKVTFYIKDSVKTLSVLPKNIIDYLYKYLGNMMISLLKYSFSYSSVLLKPIIRVSVTHFLWDNKNNVEVNDNIRLSDSFAYKIKIDGNKILKQWIEDVDVSNYTKKQDKYDILFLLLQGKNIVQKYMAIYSYLMSLVREIYSEQKEGQKHVVKYISSNCSSVGIELCLHKSSRPGAKYGDEEDQFTFLRNKIAHPSISGEAFELNENVVNELSSIVCCAIGELPDNTD